MPQIRVLVVQLQGGWRFRTRLSWTLLCGNILQRLKEHVTTTTKNFQFCKLVIDVDYARLRSQETEGKEKQQTDVEK